MRHGDEGVAIAEWLITTLGSDLEVADALALGPGEPASNRIWEGVAPEGTPWPVILFTIVDTNDVAAVGPGPRLVTNAVVDVKGVDEGETYARLKPLARRLADVLVGNHNEALADGGLLLTCSRRSGIQYPDQAEGVQYRHLGATFAVLVQ
jgi:hypothetical protein